ncbi:uridine kinase [Actinomadura syzygii]|uniref:uridine kinase family protein n=1 Tax=Actinomadura syzygii TaxID=1427538 RepID=UPI001FE79CC5|nr:hypothetical protein [Actinomadura syzygii]
MPDDAPNRPATSPVTSYAALAARLLALPPSCGPSRLVAVDGPSGAGKSTFADRLAEVLVGAGGAPGGAGGRPPSEGTVGAPVVRSDDFRVPWDADPLTWWEPLRRAVLDPVGAGRPGALRRYDWRRGAYGPAEEVPAAPVLLVEGVGAAWAGSPAAFRIWIDAPLDLRRARAADRDGAEYADAWDRWSARETAFFAADGTRARADLHVDGARLGRDRFRTTPVRDGPGSGR